MICVAHRLKVNDFAESGTAINPAASPLAGEAFTDAVTEHWVPSAMDLLTPAKAYASKEDFQAVFADDRSFIGDFDLYVVEAEKNVLRGEPLDSPLANAAAKRKPCGSIATPAIFRRRRPAHAA